MPTNLTGSSVASTYDQLLHVDDGPDATEKTVYSGTGVATALKVSTGAISVDNIKIDGNTISSTDTNGNINLSPNGTGTVAFSKAAITGGTISGVSISTLTGAVAVADGGTGATTAPNARTNLGLGTIATQDANNVSVTGGSITGITDLAVSDGGTGASTLTGYVKGNGTSAFTASATIPFADLAGRKYGQFYSTQDQTPATNTPTALTFNNSSAFNTGVTIVSNSRVTYDTTGIYQIIVSVQLNNTDAADHDTYIWFRKNGTDIADSNSVTTVPKASDGGRHVIEVAIMESITASDYIEAVVMVEDAAVDVEYTAASAGPPALPAIPSVIFTTHRIG